MKTSIIFVIALLVIVSRPCFALWGISTVSKEEITGLGAEFHATPAGPDAVRVDFEFNADGKLKGFSRVDLRFGADADSGLTAALQEDRSKPGRVAMGFSANRTYLEKIRLWVFLPESLGGSIYEFRVKDFVDLKTIR
jgi:hypothetical protein